MAGQTEAQLERQFIDDLIKRGYTRIYIKNENELVENFKIQFEQHNIDQLMKKDKTSLTENEFKKILNHLYGGSIFNKAKKLRDQFELQLDNGDIIYVSFMNTDKWCQNIFQVTNQITMHGDYENRYDVTLLINGLPLVQIELKKVGKTYIEAFHQIIRYHDHSYSGLFRYVQIFVASNGVDTKYFSNNRELNPKQTFFWTDVDNRKYSDLIDFTREFLEPCHVSKMIAKYIVLHESRELLMVLRPYQYYAVEKIIESVDNKAMKNGFIWHTTGSGKTLTSFKASQILSKFSDVDKVIFCVDRKDLDYQTMKEFDAFAPGSVDSTENTAKLVKQLNNSKDNIIITTLQKLNNVVTRESYKKQVSDIRDKRCVFIFDECHRSQFGDSHKMIDNFFTKKQFFGFTGTPIFEDNANKKRTTEMLFGEKLHSYVIKDAIADGNVLGFSVEYFKTFTDERLTCKETNRDLPYDDIVGGIDKREVFDSEERISKIVDHIIQIHDNKTSNRHYNAIFTVSSVPVLIKYYDAFKSKRHDLKIATIFSYGANDEKESDDGTYHVEDRPKSQAHVRERLDEFVSDYNKTFCEDQNINREGGFNAYYINVAKKMKDTKIDILLVVNMFLTGFDAPRLNTLYTDKNLKYHGLIQAYSRTNRILSENKSHGQIVNYRNLYKATNEAIILYSNKDAVGEVVMRPYEEYLEETNEKIIELISKYPNMRAIDNIQSESDKAEFVVMFRNIMRGVNVLEFFSDFKYSDLPINEDRLNEYKSKYLRIYDELDFVTNEKVSILKDIDFEIELLRKDTINVDYILELIADLDPDLNPETYVLEVKFILNLISSSSEMRSKRELIEEFLNEVSYGKRPTKDDVANSLSTFMSLKKEEEITTIIVKYGLDKDKFYTVINTYEYSGKIDRNAIKDSINEKIGLIETRQKTKELVKLVKDIVEKYTL